MNAMTSSLCEAVTQLRATCPLIHNITNYVTVNDCANAVLAIGASPIMADDLAEAADITAISSALVLNTGTLNRRTVESMLASGKRAGELGIPVVFDPVGAGASALRNETTLRILSEVPVTILRGNLSEISFCAGLSVSTKGVDSAAADAGNNPEAVAINAAKQFNCTVAITGAVDVVTDGTRVVRIRNGHPMLSKVTGTGCMTSALVGSFAGAVSNPLTAAAGGVLCMGIAGDIAFEQAGEQGTGSFRAALMDALSHIDAAVLEERAKVDETY